MAGVSRYTGYNWQRPDDGLVGNITHPQKGAASLSCGKELRRGKEQSARIESWRESRNNNDTNINNLKTLVNHFK